MGLFGGGNSSTSVSNLTQTENSDQRQVADNGALSINTGGGTVSILDQGIVARALDANRAAIDVGAQSLAANVGLQRDFATSFERATGVAGSQFSSLVAAQDDAFKRIDAATRAGFSSLTAQSTSTLEKFIALAGDITATGAAAANNQAKALADSFSVASGKSPNSLLILGGIVAVALLVWRMK